MVGAPQDTTVLRRYQTAAIAERAERRWVLTDPTQVWGMVHQLRSRPERTTTVTTSPEKSPRSIFSNSAARECGFTDEFWYEVYRLYEQVLADDPCGPFDAVDIERTIRREFNGRHVDVLVRGHPDAREFQQLRFTAFEADADGVAREIPRWYQDGDDRAVLGEAVLLDYSYYW